MPITLTPFIKTQVRRVLDGISALNCNWAQPSKTTEVLSSCTRLRIYVETYNARLHLSIKDKIAKEKDLYGKELQDWRQDWASKRDTISMLVSLTLSLDPKDILELQRQLYSTFWMYNSISDEWELKSLVELKNVQVSKVYSLTFINPRQVTSDHVLWRIREETYIIHGTYYPTQGMTRVMLLSPQNQPNHVFLLIKPIELNCLAADQLKNTCKPFSQYWKYLCSLNEEWGSVDQSRLIRYSTEKEKTLLQLRELSTEETKTKTNNGDDGIQVPRGFLAIAASIVNHKPLFDHLEELISLYNNNLFLTIAGFSFGGAIAQLVLYILSIVFMNYPSIAAQNLRAITFGSPMAGNLAFMNHISQRGNANFVLLKDLKTLDPMFYYPVRPGLFNSWTKPHSIPPNNYYFISTEPPRKSGFWVVERNPVIYSAQEIPVPNMNSNEVSCTQTMEWYLKGTYVDKKQFNSLRTKLTQLLEFQSLPPLSDSTSDWSTLHRIDSYYSALLMTDYKSLDCVPI